jgi:hypothetical protein
MMTTKKFLLAAAVSATFAASNPVWAATTTFTFDPTGTPGAAGDISNVALIDQAPGSALGVGAVTAIQNFLAGGGGSTDFTLLYQANLSVLQDDNSANLFSNGAGGDFFTFAAGFGETVIDATGLPSATFAFDPNNSTNFFKMYAVSALANNLTGAGFVGTPILEGVITDVISSSFTLQNATPTALDNFGTNNWPGQQSVSGSGASDISVQITSFDANYFPDLPLSSLIFSFFNTSQVTPFNQVNPSRSFTNLDGTASAATAAVGTLGATNGTEGPNFIFQADANQSLAVTVPEPASLALMGLGLMGMGFVSRRRRV